MTRVWQWHLHAIVSDFSSSCWDPAWELVADAIGALCISSTTPCCSATRFKLVQDTEDDGQGSMAVQALMTGFVQDSHGSATPIGRCALLALQCLAAVSSLYALSMAVMCGVLPEPPHPAPHFPSHSFRNLPAHLVSGDSELMHIAYILT